MTVEIRAARADDAAEVCALLHEHMDRSWPVERWRRIFDCQWHPRGTDFGRVVVQNGRIAGFLGLIRAERRIEGGLYRFANLTSWYLLRHLRGRGLGERMLRHATGEGRTTYTNLTPARATIAMVRRAGFEILDEERLLFQRAPKPSFRGCEIVLQARHEESGRPPIMRDHPGSDLDHLTLVAGDRTCHVVVQKKRKAAGRLYVEVLFASEREVLARNAQIVADAILPEAESVLAIDRRFAPGLTTGAIVEALPQPRLYKPGGLEPAAVDMLYCEIPLLDLKLP